MGMDIDQEFARDGHGGLVEEKERNDRVSLSNQSKCKSFADRLPDQATYFTEVYSTFEY